MRNLALCVLLVVTSVPCAQTPTRPSHPTRLTFDVASIRPSPPTQHGFQDIKAHADGYTASYLAVKGMIAFMYQIPARQIIGGLRWLEADRYDVEAKADKE